MNHRFQAGAFGALLVAVALLAVCFGSMTVNAQVLYGSLLGTVTDPSGAAIVGAKVDALEIHKGIHQGTTTDSTGLYRFYELLPGVWKITVSAQGFNTAVTSDIQVNANTVARVDEQLTIAKAQASITVNAAPPELQTDRADVHMDISQAELQELPMIGSEGKNFQDLIRIVPGATLPAENNSAAGNPARAMTSNVNGMSSQGNNTRIDGILDSYPWLPNNVAYVPPSDSVETVNVATNSYDAEQGMVNGAVVNVQTRTGTNKFHGDVHEFHTDDQLKTIPYFQDPATFHRALNIFNQFGGAVGGPILKNRLFFFGDYEKTWQIQAPSGGNPQTVPNLGLDYTTAKGLGYFDFTPFQNTTYGLWDKVSSTQPAGPSHVYDPRTGNAAGHGRQIISCHGVQDRICLSDVDPAALTMASLIPTATYTTATNNFLDVQKGSFQRTNYDAKISYIPSEKSTVFGKYTFSDGDIFDPPSLGPAEGNATNGGQLGNAFTHIYVVGLGGTHTFTPNLLFDGNIGYTRQHLTAESTDIAADGQYGLSTLKIPGTNGAGNSTGLSDQGYWGIPAFQFTTFTNLGNPNTGNPFIFRDNQFVAAGNLTWIKGHHEFRTGAEWDHVGLNHFQPQGGSFQTARGSFRMTGTATSLIGTNGLGNTDVPMTTQYNSYADFLLGLPDETGHAIQTTDPNSIRWTQFAAYARDMWQVTPKLSVNFGVRYEYYPGPYSDQGKGVRLLNLATMNVMIGGNGSVPEKDGLQAGPGFFLPRLGVAYKLTNSTVVRLGAGIGADMNNWRFMRNDYPAVIISDYTPQNNGGSTTYNQYAPAASFTGQNGVNSTYAGNPYTGLPTGIVLVPLPNTSSGVVPLPPGVSTGTIQYPKFRRGYIYSYNLSVEQEWKGFVFDAAYVGTRQVRPLINLGVNVAPAGGGTAGELLNVQFASLLPAGKYFGGVSEMIPFFHSYYDSLQTKATRRLGHASTVGVVYTWGKAIDFEDNEELNSPMWQYPSYMSRDKAVAGFDRKYNFETFWLYDLPFGKGQRWANHGIPAMVAGGWTFSGVLSRLSGTPFTVTDGNGTRVGALNAPGNQLTPNIIGPLKTTKSKPVKTDQTCATGNLACSYFDTSAFTPVTTAATFGNAGRSIMRGPGYFDLDSSVFRNFKIREYLTFQFEANVFGLTNTPHFGNPTSDINSSSFGKVTGELATSNASLGGSGGERQWWFGGKFIF
ncbi:MAG: TonB-dependent receptor [Terracidiphilus sp.]|jgi:hypothetical protein